MTRIEKLGLISACVIAGAIGGVGANLATRGLARVEADQSVYRAQRFEVIDEKGSARASFGLVPGSDPGAELKLFGVLGGPSLEMSASAFGVLFLIQNGDFNVVGLSADARQETARLTFHDSQHKVIWKAP